MLYCKENHSISDVTLQSLFILVLNQARLNSFDNVSVIITLVVLRDSHGWPILHWLVHLNCVIIAINLIYICQVVYAIFIGSTDPCLENISIMQHRLLAYRYQSLSMEFPKGWNIIQNFLVIKLEDVVAFEKNPICL